MLSQEPQACTALQVSHNATQTVKYSYKNFHLVIIHSKENTAITNPTSPTEQASVASICRAV